MKIKIFNRYDGSIIFEHECENNTIKTTVEKAVRDKISLRGSDLRGSDLSGCNFSGSDLSGSDLSGSNLSYSYLRGSDLSGCNFSGSDLSGSNLRGSNLRGSNLSNSDLSGCTIPIFSKWSSGIIDNKIIKIGCKKMTIDDWDSFFASEEEFETKRGTQEFKQIEAMYLANKAYLTHLNN